MKNFVSSKLIIYLSLITIFFVACNNKNNNTANKLSAKDSISPEILKISQQLLNEPNNADLLNDRATKLIEKSMYSDALTDIRNALNIDSTKSKYFVTLSDIYFALNNIPACVNSLSKAMTLDEKNTDAFLKRAEIHFYLKEYKECFALLTKVKEIDNTNAKPFFIASMIYLENADTAKAVIELNKAIEFNPDYYDAYVQLGLLYMTRKSKLAEDYLNNALRLRPQSTEALYALGYYYQLIFDFDKAFETYKKIIKIDPRHKNAYYNMGYIKLVYQGKFEEAIKDFDKSIKIDSMYTDAIYNKGYCYEMLNQYSIAKDYYKICLMQVNNHEKAIQRMNALDKKMK